ncbi:MAG TPA: ATP-binding protein [Labilithrix sp.]|nr:ATP-binding protein [Labilithrix sp.]
MVTGHVLEEVLCEDAEFVLYRAHTRDGRLVLVKTSKGAHPTSAELESLRREAEGAVVAGADVAAIPESVTTLDGRPTLVLRDDGGTSLTKLLLSRLPLDRFFPIALALIDAVAKIHARGLVHGDLHPADILLLWDGRIELIGFGQSAEACAAAYLPKRPTSARPYLSPEQTGWLNIPIDQRSDLYSLGVLFFEMLAGRQPFEVITPEVWGHAHCLGPPSLAADAPDVPSVLGEVIDKLLAMSPEARYQSASGLKHDVERCFQSWKKYGGVPGFPLGLADLPTPLRTSARVHGRREERHRLELALERVRRTRQLEAVFVSGPPGIGKTAIVEALGCVPPGVGQALIGLGRCRPATSSSPAGALLDALDEVLRATLDSSEESPAELGRRIEASLDVNLSLLAAVLPSFTRVVGPCAAPAEATIPETKNRLAIALARFVTLFSTPKCPVVVVLEDLQWADPTTLEILACWAEHPRRPPVLIVGTYGSDDVHARHPVRRALSRMIDAGVSVNEIFLTPLGAGAVTSWIAELLRSSQDEIALFSRAVCERTGTNPLLVIRFLQALLQDGQLRYCTDDRRWHWDLDAILTMPRVDGLARLVEADVERLPLGAQDALGYLAACGEMTDRWSLAAILGCTEDEATATLDDAFRARLVVPREGNIRFVHQRIGQLVYERFRERHQAIHLHIARTLVARLAPEEITRRIFEIVRHLELASTLLDEPAERKRVAELFLIAGERTRVAADYDGAARFFAHGTALLSARDWERDHELAFRLHFELARSRIAAGAFTSAREVEATLRARAKTKREHAAVHGLLARLRLADGAFEAAQAECLDGLRALGVDLPAHPTDRAADVAVSSVLDRVAGGTARSLADHRPATDADARTTCELLAALLVPAARAESSLVWLVAALATERSLVHGNTGGSAIAYATLGARLANAGRYEVAFRLGEAAYELAHRPENAAHRSCASFVFLAFLAHLSLPLSDCLALFRLEAEAARSVGDHDIACHLAKHAAHLRFFAGEPLSDIAEAIGDSAACAEGSAKGAEGELASMSRLVERLGSSSPTDPLGPTSLDETVGRGPLAPARFQCNYHDLVARFVLGDHEGAARAAATAALETNAVVGFLDVLDFRFYAALTFAAIHAPDAGGLEAVREGHALFASVAARIPSTFEAREALLAAEAERLAGNDLDAARGYELAIRRARSSMQLQVEAIASELAARFHWRRGASVEANRHLERAHTAYLEWGALRKVQHLEREFPFLRQVPWRSPDVDSVLESQLSLASVPQLADLRLELLDIALARSGAQRGCLIEVEGSSLVMKALRGTNGATFGDIDASADPSCVPLSLCRAAVRLARTVAVTDATQENRYSSDPYFARSAVHSVLCLPIARARRVTALLYLENGLSADAFSGWRRGLLECIARQAAIALDNARSYSRVQQEMLDLGALDARLAEKERLFEAILEATPMVVFMKDVVGRYILVNRQFEELWHLDRSRILGKTDHELFPPAIAERFIQQDRDALAEDRAVEFDDSVREEDGIHAFVTAKAPVHDDAGVTYAIGGTATDWTGRRRANEELRRSLSMVEATIESTEDGILVTSEAGRVVRYNRRFVTMWKVPEEKVKSGVDDGVLDSVLDQLEDPADFLARVHALYLDPEAESFDTVQFKDGRVFERYSQPQRLDGRVVGRVWSFRDVSERIRANEERARLLAEERRARADAEEAVRIRDDFLSIASHELRTPLSGLALAVESLTTHLGDAGNPERALRAGDIARRQIRRVASLVDMLLDATRIRSGKLVLSPSRVDLRAVVEETAALLDSELRRAGSELIVHAEGGIVGTWDALRIEQVVTNLLTNAIKFGRGRPIVVDVVKDGATARLSVSDNGIGIPPERRSRIFEPFTRLVSARHYGGLGLGLHITKTIVEAHGGTLTVQSEEGVGSTFDVTLPLTDMDA